MPIPTAEEKLKWIKIVPPAQEELAALPGSDFAPGSRGCKCQARPR